MNKMWVRITNRKDGDWSEFYANSVTWSKDKIIIKTEKRDIDVNANNYDLTLYAPD